MRKACYYKYVYKILAWVEFGFLCHHAQLTPIYFKDNLEL